MLDSKAGGGRAEAQLATCKLLMLISIQWTVEEEKEEQEEKQEEEQEEQEEEEEDQETPWIAQQRCHSTRYDQ